MGERGPYALPRRRAIGAALPRYVVLGGFAEVWGKFWRYGLHVDDLGPFVGAKHPQEHGDGLRIRQVQDSAWAHLALEWGAWKAPIGELSRVSRDHLL